MLRAFSGLRLSTVRRFSTVETNAVTAVATEASSEVKTNPNLDEWGRAYATGKRKESIARVWLKPGTGQCTVNDRLFSDYFQPLQRAFALEPFLATKTSCLFDVMCTVKGGGISGQAGAVRLGISRALEQYQADLRPVLRKGGFLTRDSRVVERKKTGQHKARKQYQWVKR